MCQENEKPSQTVERQQLEREANWSQILSGAEQRCAENLKYPCGVCLIHGQIARARTLQEAQERKKRYCPEGKTPAYLEQLSVAISK